MKTKNIVLISMLAVFILAAGCNSKINELTELEKADGWELLFNGENLDNWKAYNAEGTGSWLVEDGLLATSGTGSDSNGYIITKKQYDNFEVKFEWKMSRPPATQAE